MATVAGPGRAGSWQRLGWHRLGWHRLGWHRLAWAVLGLVVAGALAVGAGLGPGGPPSSAQRIAALDRSIGCPSCADLSVAESNAATAVAIRQLVATRVRQGASDQAIDATLEASYGPSILLTPPSVGLGRLVWVVPAVAVGLAVLALGLVLGRRRDSAPMVSDEDRALVERALRS